MTERVSGDRYKVLDGKLWEITRQLRQRDGYPYSLDKLECALQALIEGRFAEETKSNALDTLFTSHADQAANLRRWNEEFGWGFTEEELVRAEARISELTPEEGLRRWVLVPYWQSLYATIKILIRLAGEGQEGRIYLNPLLKQLNPFRIRLPEGIEYPGKCLMWVLVDLGSDCGRQPRDVRQPKTALHIPGLAAAAQHPNWIRAIYTKVEGTDIPAVFLAGLQVNWNSTDDCEKDDWSGMVRIDGRFTPDDHEILVSVSDAASRCSRWAVGSVVQELKR